MNCDPTTDTTCIPAFDGLLNNQIGRTANQTIANRIFRQILGGDIFGRVGYPSIIAIVVALVALSIVMRYSGVGKQVDNIPVSESSKEGGDVKSDSPKEK
jgi:hypothetical protein